MVQVRFYRHFRFFDGGRVLYSQDIIEPDDMVKVLELGQTISKKLFEGKYTFSRGEMRIQVSNIDMLEYDIIAVFDQS